MIIEPLSDENEWEKFVAASPKGTFFHTLKWRDVLEKSFPYESSYLGIRDSNDQLIGVCPFFITKKLWPFVVLNSLPESDLGGPLFKEQYKKDVANTLRNYLKELSVGEGVTYAKMRLPDRELCECLKTKTSRVDTSSGTMILDLEMKSADFIWNNVFKHKHRKYINRFEHDGFKTNNGTDIYDLSKFYTLYQHNWRYSGYPNNFKFFENMFNLLYPNNLTITLIEKDKECIGAGISFIYEEKKAMYMAGVALNKNVSSRYKIYYKLRWETIKYAYRNGYRYVSLGPTSSDSSEVHHKLKSKFGAKFNQNYILYLPFNRKLFLLRENVINVGRKTKYILPNTLLTRLNYSLSKICL